MIGGKRTKRVKRKMSKARVKRTKKSRVNRRTKRTKRTRRTRRMRGGMEGAAGGAAGGRPSRSTGKIPEDLKSYLVAVDGEDSDDIQEKITTLNHVSSTDTFQGKNLNLSESSKKEISQAIEKLEKAKAAATERETKSMGKKMTKGMTAKSMMESPRSSFGSDMSMDSLGSLPEFHEF